MITIAHRVVRQHGFLVALASGLVVLAVTLVQNILNALITQLTFLGSSNAPAWQWWVGYAAQFATIAVPMTIGVILSFWFVAPIGPDLHIVHVITRSLLAAAVGGAVIFAVNLVTTGFSLVTNGLMGQIRVPADATDHFLQALGWSAVTAGSQFLMVSPLVILVGVLLRLWLQHHPSQHEIVGIVDTA